MVRWCGTLHHPLHLQRLQIPREHSQRSCRSPSGMHSKLHTALSESFCARNLPIPILSQYKQVPRIAIQQDAPRSAWSCGTIAMCTTLHLPLGNRHPHELLGHHITRTHMLALHREFLEWLIAGTPPDLWQLGCLHKDIHPPSLAHTGPYPLLSITATTSLAKGQPWRPKWSIHVGSLSPIASPSLANAGPHVP
jgi:hypothetical protein